MLYQVLGLIIYLAGCVITYGRIIRLSNNLKYIKVDWYTILWCTLISWIGMTVVLRMEMHHPLPNGLQGKQPKLQFRMLQRFSNGERISNEY